MRRRRAHVSSPLVLAFAAERAACEDFEARTRAARDDIAERDLAIESLRATLIAFERRYDAALRNEHALLSRIDALLRHLSALSRAVSLAEPSAQRRGDHIRHLGLVREQEITAWHAARLRAQQARAAPPHPLAAPPSSEHAQRLRTVYRQLARRFHPDLAGDETRRAKHSRLMAHVNDLYQAGDLGRLQALGARDDDPPEAGDDGSASVDWPQRVVAAQEQWIWYTSIGESLAEELRELQQSAVYELYRAVEQQTRWQPRDPFAKLRTAAQQRARTRLPQVPRAVAHLEQAIKRVRQSKVTTGTRVATRAPAAAKRATTSPRAPSVAFDPHVGHALCQLGVEALQAQRLSPATLAHAAQLTELARTQPALVRLLLFAYVAQLAAQPLDAMASYDALAVRFEALSHWDAKPIALPEALVQGDGLVAYRVEQPDSRSPRLLLGLRDKRLAAAVPGMLQDHDVRELFADVLSHLGDDMQCTACRKRSFGMPLFWLRGIDYLRALLCAHCGAAKSRYVLARGDDVQAILNKAYIDFGLIYDCTIALGRRTIGLQCLSQHAPKLTVAAVLRRLRDDLFVRNGLAVSCSDLVITNNDRAVPERQALSAIYGASFRLVGVQRLRGREQQLCDELSHRVRTRYRPQVASR